MLAQPLLKSAQGQTPPSAVTETPQEEPPATPPPSPSWLNGHKYGHAHGHANGYGELVVEAEILVDNQAAGQGERWVLDDDDRPVVASAEQH